MYTYTSYMFWYIHVRTRFSRSGLLRRWPRSLLMERVQPAMYLITYILHIIICIHVFGWNYMHILHQGSTEGAIGKVYLAVATIFIAGEVDLRPRTGDCPGTV